MTTTGRTPRQQRSAERREALIEAGVWLLIESGPGGFSARSVAAQARLPLAAVSYYFPVLDELLAAAARRVFLEWIEHGRSVAAEVREHGADAAARAITAALLPPGDATAALSRYEQMLAAARTPPVATALGALRPDFEAIIAEVLQRTRVRTPLSPNILLSLVDGTVVGCLAEGRPDPAAETIAALRDVLS